MQHLVHRALIILVVTLPWYGRTGSAQEVPAPSRNDTSDTATAAAPGPANTDSANPDPSETDRSDTVDQAQAPQSRSAAAEKRQGPDAFLLPDKDGKHRWVLGFPFEEFAEAYQHKHGIGRRATKPLFSLHTLNATGRVNQDRAELKFELHVLLHSDRWVGIPLGLGHGVLTETPGFADAGRAFLHFDEAGKSFVLWLRGTPAEKREITFDLSVPCVRQDDETVLRLNTPRAVASRLQLHLNTEAVARVTSGATLASSRSPDGSGTDLTVGGLGGAFELSWRAPRAGASDATSALRVAGAVAIKVDGPAASPTAVLTAESVGRPFDYLRVRLPAGTRLVESIESGYSLRQLEPVGETDATTTDRPIVEVRLDQKQRGPIDIRLKTERTVAAANAPLNLAGFEVIGADRQSGNIAIQVEGNWNVIWNESRQALEGIRQIEVADLPESLREMAPQYAFTYLRQPSRLATRVVERQSRQRVDPEYVVFVGAQRADLHGNLNYYVGDAKAFSFEIELPGWEIDEVGPPNVVEQWLPRDEQGTILVRLQEPRKGNVLLKIRAHRSLDNASADATARLDFQVPVPAVPSHTPATVIVVPEDNVVVEPDTAAMPGLSAQPRTPSFQKLPARQQEPFYFRADTPGATFVADVTRQPQTVRTESSAQVALDEQQATVEQNLTYDVSYEPMEHVALQLPSELASVDQLEVRVNNEDEKLAVLSEPSVAGDVSRPWQVRVALGQARIGAFVLQVRFATRIGPLVRKQSIAWDVPLVTPLDGELTVSEVHVTSSPAIHVAPKTDAAESASRWESVDAAGNGHESRPAFSARATADAPLEPLVVQLREAESIGATNVSRKWIQARFTTTARQDRVAVTLTSPQRQATIQMPEGVIAERMELIVDGQRKPLSLRDDGTITVALSGDRTRLHRIELRYELPVGGLANQSTVDYAQLIGNVVVRDVYWQIVLPQDVYLVSAPGQLTAEYHWRWRRSHWARQSHLGQTHLERWVGAQSRPPLPASANSYVFSKTGDIDAFHLRKASRSMIVLIVSGGSLLLGLAIIYVPFARKAAFLITLAFVLLGIGVAFPDPTMLISQAAALGVALAVFAALMRRLLRRRANASVVVSATGSTILRPTASTSPYVAPDYNDSSATTTIALAPSHGSVLESREQ